MIVLVLVPPDSVSHLSNLHATVTGCSYTSSYSTLAMFPEPSVRAGLYSVTKGDFYEEIPKTAWHIMKHDNGSVTYSYSDFAFEVGTPGDLVLLCSSARHGTQGAIGVRQFFNKIKKKTFTACKKKTDETEQSIEAIDDHP